MNTRTDNFLKFLPFIGAFVIITSICRAIAFYSVFSIRILPYLEFSEGLLLFLDDLLVMFIPSCVAIFIIEYNASRKGIMETDEISFKKSPVLLVLGLVLISAGVLSSFFYGLTIFVFGMISHGIFFWGAEYLPGIIAYTISPKSANRTAIRKTVLALYIFIYITVITGFARGLAFKNDPKASPFVVAFFKDNRKVQTNESVIYLGRTKNYIFFYNKKSGTKTVLPTADIIEFKIK